MSALEELNSLLLSLSALKPPGANKSKITTITNLCINNATQCPALLQAISNRFSAAESTHKLGVLYVLDAVVRQWNEKARQNKEDAMASGYDPARTPNAVGVSIATQMLTPMMNDLIQSAPEDQKEKISKMIEIWERGNTFPQQMLADFKQRLGARKTTQTYTANAGHAQNLMQPLAANQSAVGTPANFGPGPASQAQTSTPTVATSNAQPSGTVSLLASLANLGKQASTPTPMAVQQNGAQYVVPAQQPQQHSVGPSVTAAPMPPYSTPAQGQGNGATGYSFPAPAPAPTSTAPSQSAPQAIPGMPGVGNDQFVQFLASLVQQGWSPEQIGQIFTAMQGGAQNQTASANNAAAFSQNGQAQVGANGQSQPTEQVAQDPRLRDNNARTHDRNHDRSPSPDRKRRRMSPVNRRDSPTYGIYDPTNNASHASNAGPSAQPPPPPPAPAPAAAAAAAAATEQGGATRGRGRKGKKRDKHRNSPAINPGPPIPTGPAAQQQKPAGPPREKYVQHDSSLPDGNIKVLSRTLFVGGVSGTEQELRSIFSQFGSVQTCIVNPEKHHAFVKMVNRTDSVAAKLGMEKMKDPAVLGKARQTRWGVGFGPRECSDYSTGISIIPINRLTEADLKWVVNSEYGGTGGRPLETGMVIEEPDIEIGTGVSSKAMSKRVGPEPGGGRHFGRHGHHHGHRGGGGGGGSGGFDPHAPRFRKPDPRPPQGGEPRPEPHTIGVPPPVPGFGFQLPGV
ncbi:uncharacterized protein IWZ02DRAFT_57134 [Phyllosticta citriasiana]|uniref:uncharacterized protein n=1 Tax=Phyllosticta citriasiana TaxID=595635 RepID=UPI0030FDA317